MNVCPRCGKPCGLEDRFCGLCGYNLTVTNNSDFVTKYALRADHIQFDLAMVYFKEEKYAQALEIFEKIHDEDPENLQVIDMCKRTRAALDNLDNSEGSIS